MLCLEPRDDHMSQTNIAPVYCYLDNPQPMGNTQKTHTGILWYTKTNHTN